MQHRIVVTGKKMDKLLSPSCALLLWGFFLSNRLLQQQLETVDKGTWQRRRFGEVPQSVLAMHRQAEGWFEL